ncbi:putative membrane protein [Oxalobacteraceae bacterium GrIS 1.11]
MSMRRTLLGMILLGAALAGPARGAAPGRSELGFQFGVIGHAFKFGPDEAALKLAIKETDQANLAFVVATGIKAASESCNDKLYARRMDVLNDSQRPLILSLAASDWSGCKNSLGKSNAIERLNRLRELLFADDNSLGARKLTLARLSSDARFRSYAENAHWESGRVLFATINLPANNNHFRPEAGRNSEFEDRLVANRVWLQRLFAMAQRKKLDGIVLFSDGDVGVQTVDEAKQDGFAAARRQIKTLAKKFNGKVLLVDAKGGAKPAPAGITWRDNLGHLSVTSNWVTVRVNPGQQPVFELKGVDAQ